MGNKEKVKKIIKTELNKLMSNISSDFLRNYKKKVHNWILKEFDDILVAHMVFVSSFESKYGNMFQNMATEIAKIKYGVENVPNIVKGIGITDKDIEEFKETFTGNEQVILSRINPSSCQEFIANFKEVNKGSGRGANRVNSSLTQEKIKEINKQKFEKTKEIFFKPVDLIVYDPKDKIYYLIEIKAGGDLDSSNAPGNVIKMLTEYAIFGHDNTKIFFATLYNKNGEGNTWTGIIKAYLSDELLLIGKNFWEFVLPEDISFNDLKDVYDDVVTELKINDLLNKLVKNVKEKRD